MKQKITVLIVSTLVLAVAAITLSCSGAVNKNRCNKAEHHLRQSGVSHVITKEQQSTLTPDFVIEVLKRGNQEYVNNKLTVRNTPERIKDATMGQYPQAAILSCLDSRVPVEDVFHSGIGDLFVARVAGNIANQDILGSLEYACKVSGSKLIVVLGHESCGAIKSAIEDVKLGNITALLSKIEPAVASAKAEFIGEATSKNHMFVETVCLHNVKHTINHIRNNSPILLEMEQQGEIKIVGGIYQMETGEVAFIDTF